MRHRVVKAKHLAAGMRVERGNRYDYKLATVVRGVERKGSDVIIDVMIDDGSGVFVADELFHGAGTKFTVVGSQTIPGEGEPVTSSS